MVRIHVDLSERLLTDNAGNRLVYFYHRYALQLAIQKDIEGRIDERVDLNMAWQVYLRMCMGPRLEETKSCKWITPRAGS